MHKHFLMLYNSKGSKKLAIRLGNEMYLSDLSNNVLNFVTVICEKNKYTFSFYSVEINGEFKNIPIIPIEVLEK